MLLQIKNFIKAINLYCKISKKYKFNIFSEWLDHENYSLIMEFYLFGIQKNTFYSNLNPLYNLYYCFEKDLFNEKIDTSINYSSWGKSINLISYTNNENANIKSFYKFFLDNITHDK